MNNQRSPHKKSKLESQILQELGFCAKKNVSDPRLGLVAFTKVTLNNDYSRAAVYWDHFDPHLRGDMKAALESARGLFRSHLSKVLTIRVAPSIDFIYDSQYEDEAKIENLLKECQNT